MQMKKVTAEWTHVEDHPPSERAMCLCADGKIRFGKPVCGDGYFYIETKPYDIRVEFWQPIPELKIVMADYLGK